MVDPALRSWIEENVAFPNSMVDRITPRATPEDQQAICKRFGVDDLVPVVSEDFTQWVVEDKFVNGRLPVENEENILFVEGKNDKFSSVRFFFSPPPVRLKMGSI